MDRPADRLALIEVIDRDGRVRRVVEVTRWPVTLGRGFDCDVVIDDPHVAPLHARLVAAAPGEGGAEPVRIEVGPTRNGVLLDRRTLLEGESAPLPALGQPWQLGSTRLRVRLPGDWVEPEKPLGLARSGARGWVTLAAAAGLWALVLAEHSVMLDPGSRLTDWLTPLLAAPAALLLWCLVWGIGSKLFQHRFEFWPHVAIAVKGLLAAALIDLVLPVAAYAFGLEGLSRVAPTAAALALAVTLYAHAALVVPIDRRWLGGGIAACVLLGIGVLATLNLQRYDRVFGELYLSTLPPPAFRLEPAVTPAVFLDESARLKQALDQRVAKDQREEAEDGE